MHCIGKCIHHQQRLCVQDTPNCKEQSSGQHSDKDHDKSTPAMGKEISRESTPMILVSSLLLLAKTLQDTPECTDPMSAEQSDGHCDESTLVMFVSSLCS